MVVLTGNLNSPELYLAGSEERVQIRGHAAFTASYVFSDYIDISHAKNILLHITLDGTGITDSQLKIQFGNSTKSHDLVHLHMDTDTPTNNPTLQVTEFEMGGTTANLALPLVNPGCSHMRCGVKANTTSGNISLFIFRGQGVGVLPVAFGGAVA